MPTYLVALVTVVFTVLTSVASASGAGKDPRPATPRSDPSTILVKFARRAAEQAAVAAHGDVVQGRTANGVTIVKLKSGAGVDARVRAYEDRTGVVYAEPNYVRSISLADPNDPSFATQWGLASIDAAAGWEIYPGSYSAPAGVKLAVLDTGVDLSHPDLVANVLTADKANCLPGTCSGSGSAQDDHGHGTHVAGIAAAVTNNGVGVAGVAFNSGIVPVKVLSSNGSGSDASVASGILWASGRGARVINLSLGSPGYSSTLCDAVASATAAGSLVVAAAGNSGTSTPFYPAACPGAVGVAANDVSGGSPSWSNYGYPNVFVSAPGVSIFSTYWTSGGGSTYASLSGTSMAAPHTAGLAALLYGQDGSRTTTDVKRLLAQTAEKIGGVAYGADPFGTCGGCTWHEWYGYGEIDALAALGLEQDAPTISSFAPGVAPTGSSVVLTGTSFTGASSVTLGFVPAPFTVDSPTQITATVPAGVSYGRWRVTTPAGTAVNQLVFTSTPPRIGSFSPAAAPSGGTVTIAGSGFFNVSQVTLGNVNASFTVDSPSEITVTVPAGVEYGRWRVTTPLWTAVEPIVFNVSS